MPQVGKSGKIHRDTTAKHSRNQSATNATPPQQSAKNADIKKNNLVNQLVMKSEKNRRASATRLSRNRETDGKKAGNSIPLAEISIIISNLKKYKFF